MNKRNLIAFFVLFITAIVFFMVLIAVPYIVFLFFKLFFATLKFSFIFIIVFWIVFVILMWIKFFRGNT